MTGVLLSVVLDIVVLVFLGVTIYYTVRLSKSLNAFRTQRNEMKKMIDVLVKNIDEANSAIAGLKAAGKSSGERLQEMIEESARLLDELQLMNQSGNNLAQRLESLADGSASRSAALREEDIMCRHERQGRDDFMSRGNMDLDSPFSIQDRDFDQPYEESVQESSPWGDDEVDVTDEIPSNLQSRAERELFEALARNRKKKSSGGGF
ncbi:MAG TPA: hypothetical protein DEA55_11470 [Rhodospirillaceae bacterium]|nr:hypothetical protein [Rhodospirillaceae bacterium]